MPEELSVADQVYYAVAELPGWNDVADHARFQQGSDGARYGRLISTLVVAGGEEHVPLAVSGKIDDSGTGNLALVYDGYLVVATVTDFTEQAGKISVSAHGFSDIAGVQLTTKHNFFSGSSSSRTNGFTVTIDVGSATFTFPPVHYSQNTLVSSPAAYAAYNAILRAMSTS